MLKVLRFMLDCLYVGIFVFSPFVFGAIVGEMTLQRGYYAIGGEWSLPAIGVVIAILAIKASIALDRKIKLKELAQNIVKPMEDRGASAKKTLKKYVDQDMLDSIFGIMKAAWVSSGMTAEEFIKRDEEYQASIKVCTNLPPEERELLIVEINKMRDWIVSHVKQKDFPNWKIDGIFANNFVNVPDCFESKPEVDAMYMCEICKTLPCICLQEVKEGVDVNAKKQGKSRKAKTE